jgi:cytochrome c-type biogenesis protein CcmH
MSSKAFAPGSPLRTWGPWLFVGVVIVATLSLAVFGTRDAPTTQDRVSSISRTVKCPVCSGESVAESNAPASQEIRRDIALRVQEGQTDNQIRSYYVARYGQAILLTPSASGINALVWILPVAALAVALAGLVIVFRRWSDEPVETASDDDRALVDAALRGEAPRPSDLADPTDGHGEGDSR